MGRKKRRKRNLQNVRNLLSVRNSKEIDGLITASEIGERIDRLSANLFLTKRSEDQDISLAAILSIQFWRQISEDRENEAFCRLAKSLQVQKDFLKRICPSL